MKNNDLHLNTQMLDLLYRSLDVQLSDKQEQMLQYACEHSKELQEAKNRLHAMREVLHRLGFDVSFGYFFKEAVLQSIQKAESEVNDSIEWFYSLIAAFRVAAVVLTIAILLLVVTNSVKLGKSSNDSVDETILRIDEANALVIEEIL